MHAGETVSARGTVRVMPPPDAVIVTLLLQDAACVLAFSVRVLDVDPAGMVLGEKLAVTPVGRPLAESATGALNPPLKLSVTGVFTYPPALTDTGVEESVT